VSGGAAGRAGPVGARLGAVLRGGECYEEVHARVVLLPVVEHDPADQAGEGRGVSD